MTMITMTIGSAFFENPSHTLYAHILRMCSVSLQTKRSFLIVRISSDLS